MEAQHVPSTFTDHLNNLTAKKSLETINLEKRVSSIKTLMQIEEHKEQPARRFRMTVQQKMILENEYASNPTNWRTDVVRRLARTLGLNHVKVYKWHYDQRKKLR